MSPPDVSDEQLAFEFLAGSRVEADGKVSFRYLEGDEQERAQAALVRLLRGGRRLSDPIRWRLAALLDPSHSMEPRRFVIENRQGGVEPNHAIDLEIAHYIAAEVATGRQIESAKEAAKDRYAVSLSTVERAWRDHKNSKLVAPIWQAGRTVN